MLSKTLISKNAENKAQHCNENKILLKRIDFKVQKQFQHLCYE